DTGWSYWRWHGAPRMYYSRYEDEALANLTHAVAAGRGTPAWVVFDNTAHGHAATDALRLQALPRARRGGPRGACRPLGRAPARGGDALPPPHRAPGRRRQPPGHPAHGRPAGAGRAQLGQAFPARLLRLQPAGAPDDVRLLPHRRAEGQAAAPGAALRQ